jgi:hypothetical protein
MVVCGLMDIHEAGYAHLNIKPANIVSKKMGQSQAGNPTPSTSSPTSTHRCAWLLEGTPLPLCWAHQSTWPQSG